jgi:hypothetical protein
MKLFWPLFSIAAAREGSEDGFLRVWSPDVDEKIFKTLAVDALTDSWTLPTDAVSGKYEPNKYYRVTVNGPEGYKIRADFSNFRLENAGFSGGCTNDKVDIFDGTDGNNLITSYCGKGARDSQTSTGTVLTVVFKSNENGIVDTGFDVTFTAETLPEEDNNWNAVTAMYDQLYLAIYEKYAEFGDEELQSRKVIRKKNNKIRK